MTTFNFTGVNGDPLPSGLVAQSGAFEIKDNRIAAIGSDPLGPKWVFTGASQEDGTFACIANSGGSDTGTHGLVFRYSNNDNFWMLVIGSAAGSLQLFKRSSGNFTKVDEYSIPGWNNAADYSLSVTTSGDSIQGSLDGTLRVSANDPHNNTATGAGMRFATLDARGDDLSFPEAATSGTITLTTPPYRIWQRVGENANVTISGAYTGVPATIERQVDGGAWTTAIASPSGGSFDDAFSLSTGQHTIAYRFSDDVSVTDSVNNIAVGDVFACAGQSNMSGDGDNNQTFSDSVGGVTAYLFGNDDNFKRLVDPYDSNANQVDSVSSDATAAGSWILRFANEWLASSEVPVGFIPAALSGTGIDEWARSTSPLTLYGSMKRRIDAVGGCAAILWQQGERDSRTDVATSGTAYQAALEQLANDFNSDFGCETFVIPLQTITASGYTNQATIRQAQIDAANANSNIRIGQALDDIDLSTGDGLHFKSDADLQTVAQRMHQSYTEQGSSFNLLVSSIPDGTYKTVLIDDSNNLVFSGDVSFLSGVATTPQLNVPAGSNLEGFVIDNQSPHVEGAVINGVTT